MKLISKFSKQLNGEINLPGDKSISHRALICAAMSEGESRIKNLQESEDVLNTLEALKSLGIEIFKKDNVFSVLGKGFKGFIEAKDDLYFGNSGTGLRLMSGVLSQQKFPSRLTGDDSLSKRPMKRIIDPLSKMGANIRASKEFTLPINIIPSETIKSIIYEMPIASAQVKSSLLYAGLGQEKETKIIEKSVTRDHTERMFEYFGANISYSDSEVTLYKTDKFLARDIEIPGDFSSAAFFIVAALISKDSKILLKNVGLNPSRIALLKKLKEMDGDIEILNKKNLGKEPVGDILIKSSFLKACKVSSNDVSNLIDELPILFIASSFAEGVSKFSDIEELRHKESDRLLAMEKGLKKMNINTSFKENIFCIEGKGKDYLFSGFEVETYFDHRIAMSFAVAGMNCKDSINILSPECISTSFPEFISLGSKLGCKFETS